MKLKEILIRVFDYNRNNKVDWFEPLIGFIFISVYWLVIIGTIIFLSKLLD